MNNDKILNGGHAESLWNLNQIASDVVIDVDVDVQHEAGQSVLAVP